MILNYIWIAFVLIAIVTSVLVAVFSGDGNSLNAVMDAMFANAKTGFEISLGLTGVLTLWLGIMKIGERGGVIEFLARISRRFFQMSPPDTPLLVLCL